MQQHSFPDINLVSNLEQNSELHQELIQNRHPQFHTTDLQVTYEEGPDKGAKSFNRLTNYDKKDYYDSCIKPQIYLTKSSYYSGVFGTWKEREREKIRKSNFPSILGP